MQATEKRNRNRYLFYLGLICLLYWGADFVNTVIVAHRPSWLLWYSSSGLLLTAIALMLQSEVLISSLFCALFVIELVWNIDFITTLISHNSPFGFTSYAFDPSFSHKDFLMTMYHLLIPPSLLLAIYNARSVFRYAWIGAAIYAITLVVSSYLFVNPSDSVNCLYSSRQCHGLFSFMYAIDNPYRIIIALFVLIVVIYVPTNYLLLKMKSGH